MVFSGGEMIQMEKDERMEKDDPNGEREAGWTCPSGNLASLQSRSSFTNYSPDVQREWVDRQQMVKLRFLN